MEAYKDIFTTPVGVPVHFQVKHSIDLIPGAPLPNGRVYMHSHMENEIIKNQIQDLMKNGLVHKKDGTLRI